MLQMSVVPLINSKTLLLLLVQRSLKLLSQLLFPTSDWTKRGVRIPLADGMDFIEEVVEYHNVSVCCWFF